MATDIPVGPIDTPTQPSTAAPSDGSGSLVYVVDGDVWLSAPDGSGARQLTTDGATQAYHDPSQGDDGTIFVLRGSNMLYRLDRAGGVVGAPVSLATLENGAEGLAASPDGTHIAYVTTGYGTEIDPRFGTPTGTFLYGGTDIATVDGTSIAGAAMASLLYPDWVSDSSLVLSDGVSIYAAAFESQVGVWHSQDEGCLIEFDCPTMEPAQSVLSQPTINREVTVLAYSTQPYFGDAGRVMAELTGPPPAPPTPRCLIVVHDGYSDTGTFSPDGTAFAFDDTHFDRSTFETTVGQGVWLMDVDLAAADCGAASARLVATGGAQPDWGPLAP